MTVYKFFIGTVGEKAQRQSWSFMGTDFTWRSNW